MISPVSAPRCADVDYFDYVRSIRQNPVAAAVKLADLAHNADQSRFLGCDPAACAEAAARQAKYARARAILEGRID